jgi:hypothetical protein
LDESLLNEVIDKLALKDESCMDEDEVVKDLSPSQKKER